MTTTKANKVYRCREQLFRPYDSNLQCLRVQGHDGPHAWQETCPTCGQSRRTDVKDARAANGQDSHG